MFYNNAYASKVSLHDSIVVSIPACHAGDRGSIPRRGVLFFIILQIHVCSKCETNSLRNSLQFISDHGGSRVSKGGTEVHT